MQRDINKAINLIGIAPTPHLSFMQLSSLSHLDLTISLGKPNGVQFPTSWDDFQCLSLSLKICLLFLVLATTVSWGSPGLDPRNLEFAKTNKSGLKI